MNKYWIRRIGKRKSHEGVLEQEVSDVLVTTLLREVSVKGLDVRAVGQ